MKRPIPLAILLALLASFAIVGTAQAETQPFERGSWEKLRARHAGKPTVIHFWGTDLARLAWSRCRPGAA